MEEYNMNYFLIGQIVANEHATEPHLTTVRLRQYNSIPSINTVITDYKMSIRYNGNGPIIVGRCFIENEAQKIVLGRLLSAPRVPYSKLASLKTVFTEGFTIDSNLKTEEELKVILTKDMKITGSKVLWKVTF